MRPTVTCAHDRRDRGQAAVVLVVVVCVLFAVLAMALATTGTRVIDRTRAQSAADAVALASLAGGRALGGDVAERHGATMLSWTLSDDGDGRIVRVVVRVGTATATARASDQT